MTKLHPTELSVIILAAGKGSRLKTSTAKPLIKFNGKKLIDFPILSSKNLFISSKVNGNIYAIVNHQKKLIEQHITNYNNIETIDQETPHGTGHAIQKFFEKANVNDIGKYILVMCADTPLIDMEILENLYSEIKSSTLDAVVASFIEQTPHGYGRIVKKENKDNFTIVEEKDASDSQKLINEVNSGLYIFKSDFLRDAITKIDNKNSSLEYYLTDVFNHSNKVKSCLFEDSYRFKGINTMAQLEELEQIKRKLIIKSFQDNGVQFVDVNSTYIDDTVKIENDVMIYPNVHLLGNTSIKSGTVVWPNCVIISSQISNSCQIKSFSHFENCTIENDAVVGPFARIRPDTNIGENCKIGNFVEIKKSTLEKGSKVSHLSYVGDAEIGKNTNIGCGFITCNYDGANKFKTKIGDNCFIGSDSQTVAPIQISNNCFVASGSTINKDMPEGSFAISRGKQITKEGFAKKFLKK